MRARVGGVLGMGVWLGGWGVPALAMPEVHTRLVHDMAHYRRAVADLRPGDTMVLSGQSDLRLAGRHLEVSNLVFRDGWAPGGEAVSFRLSRSECAGHSRITGVVIDGYSKPDRSQADRWVALYGQDDRFDHNQLLGKTHRGTTLVVRDEAQGLDDRHRIDHNWFDPRPDPGAHGGNTFRDSAAGRFTHAVGTPTLVAARNRFDGTPALQSDLPVEATR